MTRLTLVGALCLACALVGQAAAGSASTGKKLSAYPSTEYNYELHGIDWRESEQGSCAGNAQSPIDITTSALADASGASWGALKLNGYGSNTQRFSGVTVNLEQGVKLNWTKPTMDDATALPTIEINGATQHFAPFEAHFHHFASEHTLDGTIYPLELHLVMESEENPLTGNTPQLAVMGILYKYGANPDPFVDRWLDAAESLVTSDTARYGQKDQPVDLEVNVLTDMLPRESLTYASYDGSLTTPPCSEVVKWHVFTQPRTITIEQLKRFADISLKAHSDAIVVNNRIIQPQNDRPVYSFAAS